MGYVPSKNEDLAFGLNSEKIHKQRMETFFACELVKTGDYDKMDFTNEAKTIYIEMKTRRCSHTYYDTTMVGKNKVDFCATSNAECYFVFVFTDGIFYTKYTKTVFDGYETKPFLVGKREGCRNVIAPYVYIPVGDLNEIPSSA